MSEVDETFDDDLLVGCVQLIEKTDHTRRGRDSSQSSGACPGRHRHRRSNHDMYAGEYSSGTPRTAPAITLDSPQPARGPMLKLDPGR